MTFVEERILRSYCSSSLNEDYNRMRELDQVTFREALFTALRTRALSLLQNSQFNSGKASRNPIVALLREMLPRIQFTEDMVEHLIDMLSMWGSISSSISQYQQVVAMQRASYLKEDGYHVLSTSSAVAKRSTKVSKWNDQLKRVDFKDLILFQAAKGCFIEGKIVGDAIQPMVGGTTLIKESSTGLTLLVCFYNVLADGIKGAAAEPLLKEEFPMGATLRVSEPFYKIFGDGQRGIRVDNPSELHVVSDQQIVFSAQNAKKRGNEFVAKKQYLAAMDSYLKGLHTSSESDLVATLLSNRAQAFVHLKDWTNALCDAAASLTIRPNNNKTWARYRKCLLAQQQQANDDGPKINKRNLMETALNSLTSVSSSTVKTLVDMDKAQEMKQNGNESFQKHSFQEAIDYYSKSLDACGLTTRAMLSNWALCCLEIRNFGDVVASTVASLRIGFDEKALFRLSKALSYLGDYELSQHALNLLLPTLYQKSNTSKHYISEVLDLQEQLKKCVQYRQCLIQGLPLGIDILQEGPPSCMGNWIHPSIKTFLSPGKGRGLCATQSFEKGCVILVEWPLVSKVHDSQQAKDTLFSNSEKSTFHIASAAQLRSIVVHRLQREALLSKVLALLSDGTTPGLAPVSDLLLNFELLEFLLPTFREYYPPSVGEIASSKVDKILDINCHGLTNDNDCNTELYPTVSMMNHSATPNCTFFPIGVKFLSMIITCQTICAGQELTMKYHNDEVVERKWGIKPN